VEDEMLKYGSIAFDKLNQIDKNEALWANQGMPSTFFYLRNKGFIERKKERRADNGDNYFMNRYYITLDGKDELKKIESTQAQLIHEEMFFCF